MSQQARQMILDAILTRYEHDDPGEIANQIAENDDQLPRYAIVQEYKAATTGDSYWVDLTDDVAESLQTIGETFPDHGFEPFTVVDLDSGKARYVNVVFTLGDESDNTRHDFSDALAVV